MEKSYLEKVVRPYGDDFTSIKFGNGGKYNIGIFYEDFNLNELNDVVFQVYDVEESDYTFDVDDVDDDEPDYESYDMLQMCDVRLITVKDLLDNDIKLFVEKEF